MTVADSYFDVFNGDADGIFALHQLRLAEPRPQAQLVTGVKRDIHLLSRPEFTALRDADITVLDISLDTNRESLVKLLADGNRITYIDHHSASPLVVDSLLTTHITTSAETCTSVIVNGLLLGAYVGWAICGAFGDNLHATATELANRSGFSAADLSKLRELGELFNYNGYGASSADLHFSPEALYHAVTCYSDPLQFYHESSEVTQLRQGFKDDMARALTQEELPQQSTNRAYIFPDAPWSRRVAGVFANLKARERTDAAHALITENSDASYRISVRAPLTDKRDAATLCKRFPTGGGRAASAGINRLPAKQLDAFLAAFNETYS